MASHVDMQLICTTTLNEEDERNNVVLAGEPGLFAKFRFNVEVRKLSLAFV